MSIRELFITEQQISLHESAVDSGAQPLFVIAAGLLAMPAVLYGILSNLDLVNHFRFALPFTEALQHGHLYPGWLAESNAGYGDASFRFYPPALYYLLALTRTSTGHWYSGSLVALFCCQFSGPSEVTFGLAQSCISERAVGGSFLYSGAVSHQSVLPGLVTCGGGCKRHPSFLVLVRRADLARAAARECRLLAISFALLVLTHLPLTVIGSLALLGLYPRCACRKWVVGYSPEVGQRRRSGPDSQRELLGDDACRKSFIRADVIQPDPRSTIGKTFCSRPFHLTT